MKYLPLKGDIEFIDVRKMKTINIKLYKKYKLEINFKITGILLYQVAYLENTSLYVFVDTNTLADKCRGFRKNKVILIRSQQNYDGYQQTTNKCPFILFKIYKSASNNFIFMIIHVYLKNICEKQKLVNWVHFYCIHLLRR